MYDRFSDRARQLMQRANDEAQRLCHEYIGVEHILLALTRADSDCLATRTLDNVMNVSRSRLQMAIEKRLYLGALQPLVAQRWPQTPRAKKTIDAAIAFAQEAGHDYVGTEHLLLAVVRSDADWMEEVLAEVGATKERIEEALRKLWGQPANDQTVADGCTPVHAVLSQIVVGCRNISQQLATMQALIDGITARVEQAEARLTAESAAAPAGSVSDQRKTVEQLELALHEAAQAFHRHLETCPEPGCQMRLHFCDRGVQLANAKSAAFNALNVAKGGALGPMSPPRTGREGQQFA